MLEQEITGTTIIQSFHPIHSASRCVDQRHARSVLPCEQSNLSEVVCSNPQCKERFRHVQIQRRVEIVWYLRVDKVDTGERNGSYGLGTYGTRFREWIESRV